MAIFNSYVKLPEGSIGTFSGLAHIGLLDPTGPSLLKLPPLAWRAARGFKIFCVF